MRVCVVGGGFTGTLTAIAIKKHCPEVHVTMIDSDREPRNLGFGESGPPDLLNSLIRALKIPPQLQTAWLTDWLKETHSVIKYNFKWQNFLDKTDKGYYSGLPDMPSYLAILDPSHIGNGLKDSIKYPDHKEYMLYDLWYELYLAGRRKISDFEPDINSFYHYCEEHTMPAWEGEVITGLGSIHINSHEVCDWLKNRYIKILDNVIVDTVKDISRDKNGAIKKLIMDSGQNVIANFYIDCTGFKRMLGRKFDLEYQTPTSDILHNSVMIVANGYTENIDREMHPYTVGYGMDYGWTFSVPLLDRRSFGYTYDSNFISPDQALEELEELSSSSTRVVDPLNLKWQPGGYKQSWQHNFALLGLSSAFVDPFDANTIALQFRQIFTFIKWLQTHDDSVPDMYNQLTSAFIENVGERVELHQGLAPRDTSEYWKRNKEIAKQKQLEDKVFDVMNHPSHSSGARAGNEIFLPYLSHLYLTEIVYYGLDMSRRCKQSSAKILDLAEQYFKNTSQLNQLRAKTSINMRDWYKMHNIDFDEYIKFRK
jgi:flavin-dependent dehydrogenase